MNRNRRQSSLHKVRLTAVLLSKVINKYLSILGYNDVSKHQYYKVTNTYLNGIQNIFRCEGPRQAVKIGKQARVQYLALMQGKEPEPIPFRKSNSSQALTPVGNLFQISNNDKNLHRLSLSVLSLGKVIVLGPVIDFESITNPFTGSNQRLSLVKDGIRETDTNFLESVTLPSGDGDIGYSNQGGPNGPSGISAHIDALTLSEPSNREHLISLSKLASQLGMTELIKQAIGLACESRKENLQPKVVGRLEVIPDKEGKSRNIFLGDYYTQSVFRQLNNSLMRILRSIPDDYTFSQDKSKDTILTGIQEGNIINGFDLSSATERFPISLQKEVISRVFGVDISQCGYNIVSNLSFDHNGCDVKFSVGQPMGYYTSWAAFALSHHAVVYYAAYQVGVNPRGKYCIVGDDIIIKGSRLSKGYLSVMKDIGVEINLQKSTSYDSNKGVVEFLKRVYTLDGEITPFPLNSFLECYHNISNVISLQDLLDQQNWQQDLTREILSDLPLEGRREILLGPPVIQISNNMLESKDRGKAPRGSPLAAQITLRGIGNSVGKSWNFNERLIQDTFVSVLEERNEKSRNLCKKFIEEGLVSPEHFLEKLLKQRRVFNKIPFPPTVLGNPRQIANCHPLLRVVVSETIKFNKESKNFEFFKNSDIEMSVPLFKRITSLSSDRYLPAGKRKLKDLMTLLFDTHELLTSMSPTRPDGLSQD